jgi:hypothetical protein
VGEEEAQPIHSKAAEMGDTSFIKLIKYLPGKLKGQGSNMLS